MAFHFIHHWQGGRQVVTPDSNLHSASPATYSLRSLLPPAPTVFIRLLSCPLTSSLFVTICFGSGDVVIALDTIFRRLTPTSPLTHLRDQRGPLFNQTCWANN